MRRNPLLAALRELGDDRSLLLRVGIAALLLILPTLVYYVLLDRLGLSPTLFFFELRHRVHGMLYLIPVIYASAFFPWAGYAVVWLLAFAIHLPRGVYYSLSAEALIGNLGFWFVPLLAGGLIAFERQWRSQQRKMFEERQHERELYLRRILVAQEEERRRIAKELHDETLQDIIALAFAAEAALSGLPEDVAEPRAKVNWIMDQCVRISRELRRVSYDLRPSVLDQLGLVPAVRSLAERTTSAGVATAVTVQGDVERLSRQVETVVFRVVQEALTNVKKHAHATQASVLLAFSPDVLLVEVSDNGHGFHAKKAMARLASDGHLGIIGMRERAAAIGADLTLKSNGSTGTLLRLRVPTSTDATTI